MSEEENKTVTKPLTITPNEVTGTVGTIEDAEIVDNTIVPITHPPTVSDAEADTYKNFEERLTNAPEEVDWETEAMEKAAELINNSKEQ